MKKARIILPAILTALFALVGLWIWIEGRGTRTAAEQRLSTPAALRNQAKSLLDAIPGAGREALAAQETVAVEHAPLPSGIRVPRNEEELRELVAWLAGLGREELLRLSNAEFGFAESELVKMLQELQGPWVLPALGEHALAAVDPLLKAILVKGLAGSSSFERLDDPRALPLMERLIPQLGSAADDPYEVGYDVVMMSHGTCLRRGEDYVRLMTAHLATADNPGLLKAGYLFMGQFAGGETVLKDMLLAHETDDGRLGALEGLRGAALDGRVTAAEVVALGRTAIGQETDDGNRLLLYEMMLAAGGPEGVDAVEQIARAGGPEELQSTAEMLAMKMEPARARAFLEEMLGRELDAPTREAMYRAMALVPGDEGVDYLMGRVNDPALGGEERMAGLRGLWNRPVDERLAGELENVVATSQDGAMRKEALRMLFYGETEASGIDLREVGVQDKDSSVRAEAVMLAAMQPGQDTRAWLEERLQGDDSLDVKAAALGSMVMHAHYAGEGDGVLDHLARARRFTSDPAALAMIAEGERMVKTHDPRRVELGLAREAQFWNTVARFSSGPASRSFERQARQLERMVETLRAAGR